MPRLMAWYAGAVGALGMLPFLAVRLTDAGFSDSAATALLVLLPLGTLFGGPAWSWWVDHTGRARSTLTAALALSALAVAALIPDNPAIMVGAMALFAIARAPIFPLADALTVRHLGARYGIVRAVGSIAYIGVVLSSGALREWWEPWPVALAVALLVAAALITPSLPGPPQTRPPSRAQWLELVASPAVRLLLVVAFLNGLSLTTYDHLFTLHMERSGVSAWVSGCAVAWGVTIEVMVMFAGPRLLRRFGATSLLVFATASGIPRFAITALAIDQPLIVAAAQGLHGFQFGVFWIAAIHHMARLAPPNLSRSAQSLLPATGFGLATLCSLGTSAVWLSVGSTRALFAALLIPAALATAAAALLKRTR